MATNEILPFATEDTGTNLLTQAEYAADDERDIGHQPGIARSKLANKAMRQASLIAAGVAEFIADYQANNVTDGLTPQQIADYLAEAIRLAFPAATTELQGKVELATSAEVQQGTDNVRAVTPSGLSSRTATTTRTGVVELATGSEAQAGSDNTRSLTPATLRSGMNSTGSAPVYACRAHLVMDGRDSVSGSRIISGGNFSNAQRTARGEYTVTFSTEMPSANYVVLATCETDTDHVACVVHKRTTGFDLTTADPGIDNDHFSDTARIGLAVFGV